MERLFSIKVHSGPSDEKIVYACDHNLLGKKVREGNMVLEVSIEMYGETTVSEEELLEILNQASSFTLVGERVVSLAIRHKLIHPDSVLKIAGIPYAMFIAIY